MNIRLRTPSPALVIACVALFVSMGGVSWAVATGTIDGREIKNGTVRDRDIRNGTVATGDLRNNNVRGRDIRNSTIGGRDVAFDTLGGNDIKESTLTKVPDADNIDGVDSSLFVRKEAPVFAPVPIDGAADGNPEYDVDANGYVHLRGRLIAAARGYAYLPAGARPATYSLFAVPGTSGMATVSIAPSGEMISPPNNTVSLDGVSFAAAP